MLQTFKDYLITEKVNKSEYNELSNDTNFKVGMEFEYIDDRLGVDVPSDDLQELYNEFIKDAEEAQTKGNELYVNWVDEHDTTIRSVIKKLEAEQKLVDADSDEYDEFEDNIDKLLLAIKDSEYDNLEDLVDGFDVSEDDTQYSATEDHVSLPDVPEQLLMVWGGYDEDTYDNINMEIGRAMIDSLRDESDFEQYHMPSDYNDNNFGDHYGGEPPTAEELEEVFRDSDFPFENFEIGEYHGTANTKIWRIENDSSLKPIERGVEIISPKVRMVDAMKIIDIMFAYIQDNGSTNASCGFHISMSYKGYNMKKLDVFKMMMFMEEGLITKHFPERETAEYLRFLYPDILQGTRASKNDKELPDAKASLTKIKNIARKVDKNLFSWLVPVNAHDQGINREHQDSGRQHGRIEFRYMGGTNYENKAALVKTQILRYAYLLKLGMDSEFKKKEFTKKLAALSAKNIEDLPSSISKDSYDKRLVATNKSSGEMYYKIDGNVIGIYRKSTNKKEGVKLVGKMPLETFEKRLNQSPNSYIIP